MKIVFFEIEDWEKEYISKQFPDAAFSEEKLTQDAAAKFADSEVISIFIYSEITAELISKLPNLKFISTRSMGYDHIDLEACKAKNITVSYVPNYGAHTVAEHTFSLIQALSRKIIPSVERAKKGNFDSIGLTGFDLFGKTLGVLGTGHIGANVCEIALSLGMKVLAYNHHEDSGLVEKGVVYKPLDEVLSLSDIITLHLPHTKETEHIINMQNINNFKKGTFLINTARGALVETQAILYGLEQGIIKGAGLDDLEREGQLKEERQFLSKHFLANEDYKTELINHVLLQRDDVIVTQHNAFNSTEALHEILDTNNANIKSYLNGALVNIVGQ